MSHVVTVLGDWQGSKTICVHDNLLLSYCWDLSHLCSPDLALQPSDRELVTSRVTMLRW